MKSPLQTLPKILQQMDGWKVVADMSTVHLPLSDRDILNRDDFPPSLIGVYEYGWFVTTNIPDARLHKLQAAGFSKDYIEILQALRDREIWYACFDCDAPIWPDFPTHE